MTNILAFDSTYMLGPLSRLYILFVKKIIRSEKGSDASLVLYRLDKQNALIRDNRNMGGVAVGCQAHEIDALSIKFYRQLAKSGVGETLKIKDLRLYDLYTRQVKLKLACVLTCAFRIQKLSKASEPGFKIISDKQTAAVMKEALSFIGLGGNQVSWKISARLTFCVTVNSFLMRFASLLKMVAKRTDLPGEYFVKYHDPAIPTILVTMPRRRPEDFFSTYVAKFGDRFNIILYSMGHLSTTPSGYHRLPITKKSGFFRGLFNVRSMAFSVESYIADVLLIFNGHNDLNRSIDVVHSVFSNKIDAHVSRLQTNVVDNYLAIEARKREIFTLGDVMEEIFYCHTAICSSASDESESLRLAVENKGEIVYRESNSLLAYRLKNIGDDDINYLHRLLQVKYDTKIIFYASDPSKEQSQRYLTEKFLFDFFSNLNDFLLVVKTHPQDDGYVTSCAYLDSHAGSNIVLIGDAAQKDNIASRQFFLSDDFNFNSAVRSCNGFLTSSSSSILQAVVLGVKTGLVDKFGNGYYNHLVKYNASMLVTSEDSLNDFLQTEEFLVSDEALSHCGLRSKSKNFDVGEYLLKCLRRSDNNEKRQSW